MRQSGTPGGRRPLRRPGQPVHGGGSRAARSTSRDPHGSGTRAASAARPASRPAARRAATAGAARRTSATQPRRLTGRATVLVAVLIALALAYTYPVRVYLDQQSDIARLEAAQQAQREHISELSRQAARWRDDEYIRIQAKQRFYMVPSDETPLVVLFDPAGAARDAGQGPVDPVPAPDPWYETLWSSVQAANEGLGS